MTREQLHEVEFYLSRAVVYEEGALDDMHEENR